MGGAHQPPERQTVRQYLESWYVAVKPQIRASSYRRYGDHTRHLVAGLGKHSLAKLSPQQVQHFYAHLIDEGLSGTSVNLLHGMFHRALDDALKMGLVQRNICSLVRAPRRTPREMRPLSVAEVRRFLSVVSGDRFEALYVLALSTGMREGELLGLRWQDIDFDRRVLHVRMNVQETEGRYIVAETKTTYSRRMIGLTRAACDALQAHKERQDLEREVMGHKWSDLDMAFPNGFGTVMIPHNITKRSFKRHLVKAGLSRDIHFHDLRHTAATLLLSSGVNVKVVSEMLGHADVSITLRIYAHVLPHMQQSAITTMEGLIGEIAEPDQLDC